MITTHLIASHFIMLKLLFENMILCLLILTAQGETSHVKAWHLRPSLIWKDGEWVEWSSVRNDCSSMEVPSLYALMLDVVL
jgi:hypothetical protein